MVNKPLSNRSCYNFICCITRPSARFSYFFSFLKMSSDKKSKNLLLCELDARLNVCMNKLGMPCLISLLTTMFHLFYLVAYKNYL